MLLLTHAYLRLKTVHYRLDTIVTSGTASVPHAISASHHVEFIVN